MTDLSDFKNLSQLLSSPPVEAPKFIIMAPGNAAMFKACLHFQGGDQRRIKREMGGAYNKAKAAHRG